MEATKRIQLNIDVRTYRIAPRYLNIKDTIFPVLWINEVLFMFSSRILDIVIIFRKILSR